MDEFPEVFDIAGRSLHLTREPPSESQQDVWWLRLLNEGKARLGREAGQRALAPREVEALARQVFSEVQERALLDGGNDKRGERLISQPDGV